MNATLKSMPDLASISTTIQLSLRLAQPPVAMAFVASAPEGVPEYESHAPAGCRFWEDAATRVFSTSPRQHDLCSIGVYTHNLETTPAAQHELADALKVFGELGYVREQDLPLIPVLKTRPGRVVYGPLERFPTAPDLVMLVIDASQSLILSEAVQQVEGGLSVAMGRPACAVVPQAYNTGRAAMSLGCCGARAYLDVLTDNVAIYVLPGARLAEYAERIAALAKANAVLSRFHGIRREAIAAGASPTVEESLKALAAQSGGQ
jgi:uncharacterized protein (DUF169 family)